jgi:hypothetical protein
MSKGMVYAVVLNHHNNDLKKKKHTEGVAGLTMGNTHVCEM